MHKDQVYAAAITDAVERVSREQQAGLRTEIEAAVSNWNQVAAYAQVRKLAIERCPSCDSVRLESDGAWAPYRVTWVLLEGDAGVVFTNRRDPAVVETIPLDAGTANRGRVLAGRIDDAFRTCASDLSVTDSTTYFVSASRAGEERSHAVYGLLLGSRAQLQPRAELADCRAVVEALLNLGAQQRSK